MITDLLVQQIESCLPYEPNREQSELLQQLAAFVLDGRDDSLFLLRGYAGTGKTSLVGALVKALTQLQSKVVLLAPTGRAARRMAESTGHEFLGMLVTRPIRFIGGYIGKRAIRPIWKDFLSGKIWRNTRCLLSTRPP